MCTYNGARYLDDQLASLAAQTRAPDELIICDDCSTDETFSHLKKFADEAPFPVRVQVNETTLGSTGNFAQAIEQCHGDLIALCDQDDIWNPEKLALTEQKFIENPGTSLVFTDADLVDENAQSLNYTLWESLRFDENLQKQIKSPGAFELLNFRTLVTGATMMFRAKFKELVLPIPETIPLIHDGWIALLISLTGTLDIIDRPQMKYRQHSKQQLGVPQKGQLPPPSGLVIDAQRRYDYKSEIQKLEAVYERFEQTSPRYPVMAGANLDERLHHLKHRVQMSNQGLARIPGALDELLSGRYHQYSSGFKSFVKDLVRS